MNAPARNRLWRRIGLGASLGVALYAAAAAWLLVAGAVGGCRTTLPADPGADLAPGPAATDGALDGSVAVPENKFGPSTAGPSDSISGRGEASDSLVGRIVVASADDRESRGVIDSHAVRGGARTRLWETGSEAVAWRPSPGGDRVAYVAARRAPPEAEYLVVRALRPAAATEEVAGGEATLGRLAGHVWSADGRRLAYLRSAVAGEAWELRVIEVAEDSGTPSSQVAGTMAPHGTRVSDDAGAEGASGVPEGEIGRTEAAGQGLIDKQGPLWHADAATFAGAGLRLVAWAAGAGRFAIAEHDLAGGAPRAVLVVDGGDQVEERIPLSPGARVYGASDSGERLAWYEPPGDVATRAGAEGGSGVGLGGSDRPRLVVLDLGTLERFELAIEAGSGAPLDVVWSPDGERLVWRELARAGGSDGGERLMLAMPGAESASVLLLEGGAGTRDERSGLHPLAIDPSGEFLLLGRGRDVTPERADLHAVRLDGGLELPLGWALPDGVWGVAWFPELDDGDQALQLWP